MILFGEHFVVYGEPAIALAINLRVKAEAHRSNGLTVEGLKTPLVDKAIDAALRFIKRSGSGVKLKIRSNLPMSVGLGSSAAAAVAIIASVTGAFGVTPSREELFNMALDVERTVHVNPSGIDPAISVNGGAIIYAKKMGVKPVELAEGFTLILGNTGIARSTGAMVEMVRRFAETHPETMMHLRRASSSITIGALKALREGNLKELGLLMNVNHGLLEAIGVSSPKLNRLVYAAREAGALGAKLTGAGGGGCMVALTTEERVKDVAEAIGKAGGEPLVASISREGVIYEG